ncbi:FGGY-family carbohydrate kinase [Aureimonas frigidaquae]|uniref:Xylulokinase protein n=1 Tax=Aureimonas frigidaquae TaxID=424757 RepID=A0A0P0Z2A2_9HYPH|nr:FGGY-family carbohydrate kinase [Aureimonas frigidaquae]BAT28199.1 xylulokinase protein [Aureimonas frigidaquae]
MTLFLGLDIGTTSTIGILIEPPNRVLAIASRPVTLHSDHPGWAEEDPAEWWDNVCALVPQLLASAGAAAAEIGGIGVAGMLPATVLLDGQGQVLRRSIQQSDGRCGAEVAEMQASIDQAAFLAAAGNGVNQQLVGAKIRWLARHEPQILAQAHTVLGSYDYVNYRLTGRLGIEQNWALEAGVVRVATGEVDPQQAELSGLPARLLPPLVASSQVIGHVTPEASALTGLHPGTPVVGGAADMIASALGAGVVAPGDVLLKFGGAVDILTVSETPVPDERMFLDYHLVPGLWMPNGCMSTGGSVLNWVVATFAGHLSGQGGSPHAILDAMAAERPAGSDGLTVLPYFLGEKTPLHDPAARGVIEGLTLSHDLGHIWRAVLESYAYAIRHHVETLQDMGHPTRRFLVSDGGARSGVWMQIVCDVLGAPLSRLSGHPGSCLGAAWTAAVGTGAAEWDGISAFTTRDADFTPDTALRPVYDAGYARFRATYAALRSRSA